MWRKDAAALFTNTNIPTRVVAKDSMKLSDHSFGRQKLLLWVGGVGDEQTVTASKEGCEHPVRRAGQDVERCGGISGNSFPTKQGKDPSSQARSRKRDPPDVAGTLVLLLKWRRVCRGTS